MIMISYVYHIFHILVRTLVITNTRNIKKLLWEMQQARQKCVLYGQLTLIKLICWEILSLWSYSSTLALEKKNQLPSNQ